MINTIKKLFSSMLAARLINILNENKILKLYSFGFMKNLCTKDRLLIFRSIINNAKTKKDEVSGWAHDFENPDAGSGVST